MDTILTSGVTYYKLPDKKVNAEDETTYSVYYVREENAAIMNATNVRRSNLNITKEVTGEAPEDAAKRELQEETGIIYDLNQLKYLLTIKYYQLNYLTRNNEYINRLMTTHYYLVLSNIFLMSVA